jgi:hypothetical protein
MHSGGQAVAGPSDAAQFPDRVQAAALLPARISGAVLQQLLHRDHDGLLTLVIATFAAFAISRLRVRAGAR